MIEHSILPEQLKDFDYYLHKLPMYLQQSEGFSSHFRIWYDLLVGNQNNNGVVGTADTLFSLLNIFDVYINESFEVVDDYLTYLNSLPDNEEGTQSDILDKLAELFGVTRVFQITYTQNNQTHTEVLHLNNKELLLLIRTQIIRNYCDGTYEQIRQYYNSVGLQILMYSTASAATLDLYLVSISGTENAYSANIQKLFLAGLLTIASLGISYNYAIQDTSLALYWSEEASGVLGWTSPDTDSADENGGQWII